MVISRMKTEDVTDAARIEEKIFSTPWSEQSFLEALEQEYTVFSSQRKKNTAWVTLELILLRMRLRSQMLP